MCMCMFVSVLSCLLQSYLNKTLTQREVIIYVSLNKADIENQTFQVADLMLTVRPLLVSVLFILRKKFLSLACPVNCFLLEPEKQNDKT